MKDKSFKLWFLYFRHKFQKKGMVIKMFFDRADEIIMRMSFTDAPPDAGAKLKDDLGIDSLRLVELIVALEEAYAITFKDSDLDPQKLITVSDLYNLVETYAEEDYDALRIS